jgi:hypothetical protein
MKLSMDCFQALLINVRVNLRRRNIRVSEHLLDDAQIGSIPKQMGGKTMPEQMRINVYPETGPARNAFDDLPNSRGGQFASARGKEDFATRAAFDELGSFLGQVSGERCAGLAANRHEPRFVRFAPDAQDPFVAIEIFETRAGQLGNAQTAGVEQLDHSAVAPA